jgi:hypothetical protein
VVAADTRGREYGARLIEQQLGVAASAIEVDETAVTRAGAVKPTVFTAGVVDLHRGKLIDIVAARSRKVLADWLFDQPTEWAAEIEVAATVQRFPVFRREHLELGVL